MSKDPRLPFFATLLALLLGAAHAQTLIEHSDGLVAAFASGGAFQIAAGSYAVEVPLLVQGELSIVGSGRDDVLIELSGGPIALRVGEGARLHLQGMRLLWGGETPSDLIVVRHGRLSLQEVDLGFARAGHVEPADPWRPGGHGSAIVLQGSAEAELGEVRIVRSEVSALELLGDSRLRLQSVHLADNFRGLIAGERATVEAHELLVFDQSMQALLLMGQVQATLVDSIVSGNGVLDAEREQFLEAIRVIDDASLRLLGGVLRGSETIGLIAAGSAEVVLRDMLIEANGDDRPDLGRAWPAVFALGQAQVAVQQSTVRGNRGGAFELRQNAGLVLEGVLVEGNGGVGHVAAMDQSRLAVQDSRFVGNAGMLFVGDEAKAGIYRSQLLDGQTSGVVLASSASADLIDNLVAGHAARGVWIDGGASAELRGNTIEGNEMGLWMTEGTTATVSENRFIGNRNSGVVLGGSARILLEQNQVSGNAVHGVALFQEAGAILRGNELSGNVGSGLFVAGAASATLEGNTFSGSEWGVRLEAEGSVQGSENVFADNGQDVSDAR